MKFKNSADADVAINISHITQMEDMGTNYLIRSFSNSTIIAKDANSQKLFQYMQAKAAKDILVDNNLDKLQKSTNDIIGMFANINLHKND